MNILTYMFINVLLLVGWSVLVGFSRWGCLSGFWPLFRNVCSPGKTKTRLLGSMIFPVLLKVTFVFSSLLRGLLGLLKQIHDLGFEIV